MKQFLLLFVLLAGPMMLFGQDIELTAQPSYKKLQCTTVQFTDKSYTPIGAPIVRRRWDFGDGTTDTVPNPVHTYSQRGHYYPIKLTVENSAGTLDSSIGREIRFETVRAPNLGADVILEIGDSLVLDARKPSMQDDARYQWSTGDTTPVIHVHSPGAYWAKINICGETASDTIVVSYRTRTATTPVAGFGTTRYCRIILFADSSYANGAAQITKRLWSFGDGTTDTSRNPQHSYLADGTYKVFLTVTNYLGEKDTVSHTLSFNGTPIANLGADTTIQQGNIVLGTANTQGPALSYRWSTGDTTRTIVASKGGTYWVRITSKECRNKKSYDTIRVLPLDTVPVVWLDGGFTFKRTGCLTYQFIDTSKVRGGHIAHYRWKFEGDPKIDTTQNPVHTFSTQESYIVTQTVVSDFGDSTVTEQIVWAFENPDISLYPGQFELKPEGVELNAGYFDLRNRYEYKFLWSTGDTVPTITVDQPGRYWVTITDNLCGGTTDSASAEIVSNHAIEARLSLDSLRCNRVFLSQQSTYATYPVIKWEWDFGDGTTDTVKNPIHNYAVNGTYKVTLKVTNSFGDQDSAAIDGIRTIAKPVLDLGRDTTLTPGDSVVLDASKPYWSFWNTYDWSNGSKDYAIVANTPGIYWVRVNYCDASVSDTIVITADTSLFPVARLVANRQCSSVQFTDKTVTPTGSFITFRQWNFGDNTTDTTANPLHTYSQPGTYAVSLLVENSYGRRDTAFTTIHFAPITVNLGADTTLAAGDTLILNASRPKTIAGAVYLWENGSTWPYRLITTPGTYRVNVTSCDVTVTDTIHVLPADTSGLEPGFAIQRTGCRTYKFTDTSSAAHSYITNWFWQFGDYTTDTLRNPVHYYSQPGQYTVMLVIGDNKGQMDSTISILTINSTPVVNLGPDIDTLRPGGSVQLSVPYTVEDRYGIWWSTGDSTNTITVTQPGIYAVTVADEWCGASTVDTIRVFADSIPATPPTAQFTANKLQCTTVQFTDQSTAPTGTTITSRQWSFGDNTTDTAINPLHIYSQRGTYIVSLLVENSAEERDTAFTTIYFAPIAVNLGADTTLAAGDSLLLDARKPDKLGDATYLWSTGDTTPVKVVYMPGSYWVNVTACGTTVTDTISISSTGTPPPSDTNDLELGFAIQQTGCRTYQFTDTSKVTAGSISRWMWQFGDNTADTLQNPVHTYNQPGAYTIRLLIEDNMGQQDSTSAILVVNSTPVVNLGQDIDTLRPGGSIQLFAHYPVGAIYSVQWSTGDTANAITVRQPGTYAVTVTDIWCGTSGVDTIQVFADTIPAAGEPQAQFTANKRQCTTVQFTDQSTTPAGTTITSRHWSFGDNTTDTAVNPLHTYSQRGTYTVSLLVKNSDEEQDTAFTTIYFAPIAVNLGADTTLAAGDSLLLDARKPEKLSGATYLWSTGDTTPVKVVYMPGSYWVNVISCGITVSDTIIISAVEPAENPADIDATTTVNANDSLTVAANFDHNFNSNNVFTIQLLQGTNTGGKKAGDQEGEVTNLATIAGTDPRIAVKVTIPDTIPCGQDYQVRIVSSSPADTTDWSAKFAVVNTPVAIVQQRGDSLFAGKALTYQWYFNGAALTGATTAAIRAKANGQYYVMVSNGSSCRSTSSTLNMIITAVPDVILGENIVRAFPNPTAGLVYIRFEKPLLKPVNIIVHDARGNTMYRKQVKDQLTEIDLGALPKGVYYLELAGYGKQKAMRIILQ